MNLLRRLATPAPARRRPAPLPPAAEVAEPRRMLTTIVVDSLADDGVATSAVPDGQVTLREAVIAANTNQPFGDAPAGNGRDRIRFADGLTGTITLTRGQMRIEQEVDVRAYEDITIDADGQSRVFSVLAAGDNYFQGLTLTNGNADRGGAVLHNGRGTVRFTDVTFTGNNATTNGGALALENAERAIVFRTTFTGNTATGNGGAVHARGGGRIQFFASDVGLTNGGNSAQSGGGIAALDDTRVELRGGRVAANNGSVAGGGVWMDGEGSLATLVVRNDATVTGNSAPEGGGVFIADTAVSALGFTLSGNNAARGGGMFVSGGGRGAATRTTFSLNTAGEGGGLYTEATGRSLRLAQSDVTSNNATRGGGVFVAAGTFTTNDSTYAMNTASQGGGVYLDGADLSSARDAFQQNSASGDGGGVHFNAATGTLLRTVFTGNTATRGGGAFLGGAANRKVVRGALLEFNGNDAGSGGGLAATAGRFDLAAPLFTANGNANGQGGGAYLTGSGDLTVRSAEFRGNFANRGAGAYLANPAGTLTLAAGGQGDVALFAENVAADAGGAVFREALDLVARDGGRFSFENNAPDDLAGP